VNQSISLPRSKDIKQPGLNELRDKCANEKLPASPSHWLKAASDLGVGCA
jgi:hypothetical protein